ncbi:LacI family DNA-binding transcriptional regulator [Hutsoniella sourekii]
MATIKDVAKLAGVSVTTVSRYLNNHPYISEEKQAAIQQAMADLNYIQNSAATQLRSKKSNFIGILVSRLSNPFFTSLVDKIEQEVRQAGYYLMVMQTYDDTQAEQRMLSLLQQGVLAGLIMCSLEAPIQEVEAFSKYGPILLCNLSVRETHLPYISTDQRQGTYQAVKYIADKHYQSVAYCTGGSLSRHGHGDSRTQAFEMAIDQFQLTVKREWIFPSVHLIEDGRRVAEKLFELSDRPQVVFANSDEVAAGIVDYCYTHQLRIPEDLAVMGFDNQFYSGLLTTPLTTIDQPVQSLGKETSQYILALIEGIEYQVNHEVLEQKLIVRNSI